MLDLFFGNNAVFQMGKEYFEPWNAAMRDPLIKLQEKAPGDTQGSWAPEKNFQSASPDRVAETALACLCLEVYYRYLPVYKEK